MSKDGKYDGTLNLPRTDFPMRANLPRREPELLAWWRDRDLYGQLREARRGRPRYILHDGPPYANGGIHMGTALNKILKDFLVRFASMTGHDAPYVPGWDCHGLPIELAALKTLGIDHHQVEPLQLRRFCREYALRYVNVQREQFMRLGVMGDWYRPYLTMEGSYEARQVEVFGEMARRGYIYKGLKSVHWCATCETALAEAEVEYRDRQSPSIWVAFQVVDGRGLLPPGSGVVIWTTTPWTLPANVAIAVHPDATYALVDTERGKLVLARSRVDDLCSDLGLGGCRVEATFRGSDMEGVRCRHPFVDRESVVVTAEYVSLEEGTGCVHIAPGHGPEDFEVGRRYGLPVLSPIDGRGRFTSEAGWLEGRFYRDADPDIMAELERRGALLGRGTTLHSYPCCWRCKNPLLFRATEQWFASVEGFRDQALQAIDQVTWVPAWGKERIRNMVRERTDWCVSRQRAWGVPIPVFYCTSCGEPLVTPESIAAVASLFRREGSDAWYQRSAEEILPPGTRCRCGGTTFEKESDIMDVWFDSGSSHAAVLEEHPDLTWPADCYLEGSDQHRGWFQSSLLTSVATRGRAPYSTVITHGFVLDGEGRAMHKSLGNVIDPAEITEKYGADVLRLWVAASDYRDDVRLSLVILDQLAEVYRKIRNTLRFVLGNLFDFQPDRDEVPYERLSEVDRWALHSLARVIDEATRAFSAYEYHVAQQVVHTFCTVDMSQIYLDVIKDRLYCSAPADPTRRAAQTVLYHLGHSLVRVLAPILPFTTEEVWQHLPHRPGDPWSVHLAEWPRPEPTWKDEGLARRWEVLLAVRDVVLKALEEARAARHIGGSLEAALDVYVSSAGTWGGLSVRELLTQYLADLPALFIVSQVRLREAQPDPGEYLGWAAGERGPAAGVGVGVLRAAGTRCARCWIHSETVGRDAEHRDLCERCADVVRRRS